MQGRKNKVTEIGIKHRWLYRGRKMEADLHQYSKDGEQFIEVCTMGTLVRVWEDGNVVVERRTTVESQTQDYDDIRIRKVGVLGDRAKQTAIRMKLKDDDLVIVKTKIKKRQLPKYELEKIEGSPIKYLQRRAGMIN